MILSHRLFVIVIIVVVMVVYSDYRSSCHSPSHNMQLLSLAPSDAFLTGIDGGVASTYHDKDYVGFSTQHSQTGYNYLDPNFYPAS